MTTFMKDHWWWRPGWRVGRRMYTWHITFTGQNALHELVDAYQERLSGLDGLDPIPRQWLHMTTQGLGFTDETPRAAVEDVVAAARTGLAEIAPQAVTVGPAEVEPEVVRLSVHPAEALAPIRRGIRDAITTIRGSEFLMEDESWSPHISVAYSNSGGEMEPIAAALQPALKPVSVPIDQVELIALGRDEHLYRWDTVAVVPLAY